MWDELRNEMDDSGTVEYGIFQRDRKPNAPIWRRHKGAANFRFKTVFNALFADKGARNACYGRASYPKEQYANSENLLVPYVATWLSTWDYGYLVRASAGDPEITIVSTSSLQEIHANSEAKLTEQLAELFAKGAANYGVRLLGERSIRIQ